MRERGSETGPESRVTDPDPEVTDPQALRVPSEDLNQPPTPWGIDEDSPKDEGSEPTAVGEARRGERRAGKPPEEPPERQGMLPPAEPTRAPEAGPGLPDPGAPAHEPFPLIEEVDGGHRLDR